MLPINEIHLGDCLELMKEIPDKSIGMVLSDLPYGKTRNKWDKIIPLEPLWTQLKRVIRPKGAIVLTARQPFSSMLVVSNLSWLRYDWIWRKSTPTGHTNCKIMPLQAHEQVLVFGKGRVTYNPQLSRKPWMDVRRPTDYRNSTSYGNFAGPAQRSIPVDQKYPQSVLEFNTAYHDKEAGLHPNQKPTRLFSYLIKTHSNPGDIILDCAAGSCTTAIAATDVIRPWICIEKHEPYFEAGVERLKQRLLSPYLLK